MVIGAYEELWRELAARRSAAQEVGPRRAGQPAHPLRADPFYLFSGYPTHTLGPNTRLAVSTPQFKDQLAQLRTLNMNTFGDVTLAAVDIREALLQRLASNGPSRIEDLLTAAPTESEAVLYRTLGWMLKTGLVRSETA